MSIWSKIKSWFNKKIDASGVPQNNLITLVSSKPQKFGKQLEVPDGYVAIMTYKGKVADAFVEGCYRLEIGAMPILSRISKLQKPDKKGNLPTKFCADIYFVSTRVFENRNFASNYGVKIKNKQYKTFWAKLYGQFSFQVVNVVSFMEAMLTQYGVVNNGVALDELGFWVGNLVDKKVQKNKPDAQMLFERASVCFQGLVDYVNEQLFDCGVKLSCINILQTKFPKRIYKLAKLDFAENNIESRCFPSEPQVLQQESYYQNFSVQQTNFGNSNTQNQTRAEQTSGVVVQSQTAQSYETVSYNGQSQNARNSPTQNMYNAQMQNNVQMQNSAQIQNNAQTQNTYNKQISNQYNVQTQTAYNDQKQNGRKLHKKNADSWFEVFDSNANNDQNAGYTQNEEYAQNSNCTYNARNMQNISDSPNVNNISNASNLQNANYVQNISNMQNLNNVSNMNNAQNANVGQMQNDYQMQNRVNNTQQFGNPQQVDSLQQFGNSQQLGGSQQFVNAQQLGRVDLNQDAIKNTISYIRCSNCGAYNSGSSNNCFACKCKLK